MESSLKEKLIREIAQGKEEYKIKTQPEQEELKCYIKMWFTQNESKILQSAREFALKNKDTFFMPLTRNQWLQFEKATKDTRAWIKEEYNLHYCLCSGKSIGVYFTAGVINPDPDPSTGTGIKLCVDTSSELYKLITKKPQPEESSDGFSGTPEM